jgi:hypothetical protein
LAATPDVVTVKVAVVVPDAMVTEAGTDATPAFALVSATIAPPGGACPVRATVPVEVLPPTTEAGLRVRVEIAAGFTVTTVVRAVPFRDAVIVMPALDETPDVGMLKEAVVAPAVTATVAGTLATTALLEDRPTINPFGAGELRVTVPVDGFPPTTVVGLTPTAESAGGLTARIAA